jgi:hypothetical protein
MLKLLASPKGIGFSHFSLSSLGGTASRVPRWHTSGSLSHVALSFIKSNSKLQNCCVALRIGKGVTEHHLIVPAGFKLIHSR